MDPNETDSLGRYNGVGQGRTMSGAWHLLENLTEDVEHSILVRAGVLRVDWNLRYRRTIFRNGR